MHLKVSLTNKSEIQRLTHASITWPHTKKSTTWAMVTKDRSASDSSYGSTFKEVRFERKRDMVFGSNFNSLATNFTGFWYATLSTKIVSCLTWCAMQSSHLSPLKVPLQLSCSSQIGRALMQMLTCRCLETIQSIILSWALFPRHQWHIADKIYGLETIQALQLLNGILKLLLCGIKKHSTCYLIRTQGGVQPCLMPYPRQFSSPAHIHPLRTLQI